MLYNLGPLEESWTKYLDGLDILCLWRFRARRRPLYINIALYNRSSVARAGRENIKKGQGRKRQARPHDACILGRLQAVTRQMGQVDIWSRRVLRRSLSITCTPHLHI